MPPHLDAVGYLYDLANEVNKPWFKMVCELAVSGVSALDEPTLGTLFALYKNTPGYIGTKPAAGAAAAAAAASPTDFLEQLSGFTNFKRLDHALNVSFKTRITLIFGANGSGKSSLCESLKVLAIPDAPNRPLENVRVPGAASPTFAYRFKGSAAPQTWTVAAGYGPRRATIKYFDTAIAIQNVKNAVPPGRVIALTPFKLHVFERATALTKHFRTALERVRDEDRAKLNQTLEAIRKDFAKFEGRPLSIIDDTTVAELPAQIQLGERFAGQTLLSQKQAAAIEFERAASEDGLKLLRAEHRELETYLASLTTLLSSAAALWTVEPATKAKLLADTQAEQEVLAKALIPTGETLDGLLNLLRAAEPLCEMSDAADHACPLCKRDLGVPEVELFKRYHDLLSGELEKEIAALKDDIATAIEFQKAIFAIDRESWAKYATIQSEILTFGKTSSDLIVGGCDVSREPSFEAHAALESLKASALTWAALLDAKKNAIDATAKGSDELVKQLATMRGEIEPLEYAQTIGEQLEKLRTVEAMEIEVTSWAVGLPVFTQLLKRITDRAKVAYEELVVIGFEARLNAEYEILAERDMPSFGVILARIGTESTVTVLPQIGGNSIEDVLSEGEQRLHALALFFAELETCPQSVLVFDDPISSVDYNYIANYCVRLRDFALSHPNHQIIAMTHNWEFFVQLQTTLNRSALKNDLSVQVLENCSVVADYSENVDVLNSDISRMLSAPGEPSKVMKEEMAGKMRRLVESVVNTHVFNKQRHQYKQKPEPVSTFDEFTKIVPLLPAEAVTLRDLYAKLSIPEHDDPRNAYVNSDKAIFQTRYDSIRQIETAIRARKP